MGIGIAAISYYLPEKTLTNDDLAALYGDWTAEKIFNKTGICRRNIDDDEECTSKLDEKAALNLLNEYGVKPETIDFILLATQSLIISCQRQPVFCRIGLEYPEIPEPLTLI